MLNLEDRERERERERQRERAGARLEEEEEVGAEYPPFLSLGLPSSVHSLSVSPSLPSALFLGGQSE